MYAGFCVVGEKAALVGCDGTKLLSVRACPSLQAPETLGSQRIFFRDQETNELKTVALTVENRTEVTLIHLVACVRCSAGDSI